MTEWKTNKTFKIKNNWMRVEDDYEYWMGKDLQRGSHDLF